MVNCLRWYRGEDRARLLLPVPSVRRYGQSRPAGQSFKRLGSPAQEPELPCSSANWRAKLDQRAVRGTDVGDDLPPGLVCRRLSRHPKSGQWRSLQNRPMKSWARTSSFILLSPRIGQVISFVAAAGRVAWSKQSPSSGLWECGNRRLGDSQARGETMENRRLPAVDVAAFLYPLNLSARRTSGATPSNLGAAKSRTGTAF